MMSILAQFEQPLSGMCGIMDIHTLSGLTKVKPPIPAQIVRVSYAVVGEKSPFQVWICARMKKVNSLCIPARFMSEKTLILVGDDEYG